MIFNKVADTLLVANATSGTRSFGDTELATVSSVYKPTADLTGTAAGNFTINGTKSGTGSTAERATIDLDSHKGFDLANATTLNINNTKITNGADGVAIAVSKADANVNLNGAYIDGKITSTAAYDLTTAGETVLNGDVTAGTLTASGTLTNNGALNVGGGSNAGTISGTGSLTNNGEFTNTGTISQAVTHNGTGTNAFTNNGTISGAVDNNGEFTNNSTISGSVDNSGTFTNNSTLSSTLTNSGTFTNGSSGTISGAVTNTGTLNTSASGIQGGVTNNGTGKVELTGGTLATNISGTGATEIKAGTGTVSIGTGSIANNVTITSGTLASSADKISGTITNNATFNMSGNLTKDIAGTGTTVLQSDTSAVAADRTIEGTLNANGKTIVMKDSAYETLTVGSLNGDGNITLDVNAQTNDADKIHINNSGSSSTLTVTDINFTKPTVAETEDSKVYTKQILTNNTAGASLVLGGTLGNPVETELNRDGTDYLDTNSIDWDANYGGWTQSGTQIEQYSIIGSSGTLQDTLKYELTKVWNAKNYSAGKIENLSAMNAYNDANRSVNFAGIFAGAEAGTYTVASNLGTSAAGTYTLIGVKGGSAGTTNTTVDLNNHSGFVLANATNLVLENIDLKDSKTSNATLITVSNNDADISLNNANIQGAITKTGDVTYDITATGDNSLQNVTGARVANGGNLSLSGTNGLVNITGSGSTTITGGATTSGAITQNSVAISGGKLVATNGVTTTNGITNTVANGLEVTGGTINSNISGTGGSTKINTTGTVSLADGKQISQAVNLAGGTFNSSADGIKGGVAVTAGEVELTGGTLTTNITGNGATEIKAGTGTVSIGAGSIGNNVTITSGTLASTADKISGTITNNATFNMSGDLTKNIAGSGTTVLQSDTSAVAADRTIDGTLNANGKTIGMKDSAFETLTVNNLTGGNSNITINAKAATQESDKIAITSGTDNNSALTITGLTLDTSGLDEGVDYTKTMSVVSATTSGTTSGVTVEFADGVATPYNQTGIDISKLVGTDSVGDKDVVWNETFGNWEQARKKNTSLTISGTDMVYTVTNYTVGDKVYTSNSEGLKELNVFNAGTETKTFNAASTGTTHTVIEDLGNTVGKLSIDGKGGTLDFGGTHKAFEKIDTGAEVNLNNVKLTNANGDIANVVGGKLTATNSEIDGTLTSAGTVSLTNSSVSGNVTNSGTLNLSNSTIDGIIIGSGDDATLNVNSDWDMDTTVTGHQVNVNGVKLTVGAGNLVGSDSLTAKDGSEIDIAANKVSLDKAEFKSGSKLSLKVDSLNNFGAINANNITVENGANLSATLAQGIVKIGQKETLQLLKANNSNFNNFADSFDNNMYHFEKADKSGLYNISQVKTAEEVAEETGASSTIVQAAGAWVDGDEFAEGSTAKEVADALADLAQNDAQEFNNALSVVAPQDAPVVETGVTDVSDKLLLTVENHLTNNDIGGLSSGDALQDVSIWAKGYYGKSKLSDSGNIRGFDAKNKGVIAGVDKKLNNAVKLGFGFQYNDSDIDAFRRDVEVDTVTGFIYGEYRPSNWYVNGVASYGRSDYKEKKFTLGFKIDDKYNADTYSLQAITGYDFKYVSPEIGARYYHIKRHSYDDSIGQKVSGSNMDLLRGVLGLRASHEFGMFKPEVYVGITYDIVNDKDGAIVSLPNGSSYAVDGKRLNRFGTEVNTNLTANLTDHASVTVGYEGKFRKDYKDNTGLIIAKYAF